MADFIVDIFFVFATLYYTNYGLILHHALMANVFKINSSEEFEWVVLDSVVVLHTSSLLS